MDFFIDTKKDLLSRCEILEKEFTLVAMMCGYLGRVKLDIDNKTLETLHFEFLSARNTAMDVSRAIRALIDKDEDLAAYLFEEIDSVGCFSREIEFIPILLAEIDEETDYGVTEYIENVAHMLSQLRQLRGSFESLSISFGDFVDWPYGDDL